MYVCSRAVLEKALGRSSHAHKCRDHAPYFAHARIAVKTFIRLGYNLAKAASRSMEYRDVHGEE